MAATNGYTPEQASDLYIADGTINDWMWGDAQDLQLHVRDVPDRLEPGLLSARRADRPADLAQPRGGPAVPRGLRLRLRGDRRELRRSGAGQTVYFDNFEAANGWTAPAAGDTATAGQWVRGNPAGTNSGGVKQLDATVSGSNDLVTGASAGAAAGDFDVDGGVTTDHVGADRARPVRQLHADVLAVPRARLELEQRRLPARGRAGRARTTTWVWTRTGAAANLNGAWSTASASLNQFAGQQTVRIVVRGRRRVDRQPRRGRGRRRQDHGV